MNNAINRSARDVLDDRLEGREVPVDVADDSQSHPRQLLINERRAAHHRHATARDARSGRMHLSGERLSGRLISSGSGGLEGLGGVRPNSSRRLLDIRSSAAEQALGALDLGFCCAAHCRSAATPAETARTAQDQQARRDCSTAPRAATSPERRDGSLSGEAVVVAAAEPTTPSGRFRKCGAVPTGPDGTIAMQRDRRT
jgi:hypothetical protein